MLEHHKKFLIISAIFLCISVIILFLLTFVPNPTSSKIPVSTPVEVDSTTKDNPTSYVQADKPTIKNTFQIAMNISGTNNPVATFSINSPEEFITSSSGRDFITVVAPDYKITFYLPYDRGGSPDTLEFQRVGTFYEKPLFKLITDLSQYSDTNSVARDGFISNIYGTNDSIDCNLPIDTVSTKCKAMGFSLPYTNINSTAGFEITCGVKDGTKIADCTTIIENLKVEITAAAPNGN